MIKLMNFARIILCFLAIFCLNWPISLSYLGPILISESPPIRVLVTFVSIWKKLTVKVLQINYSFFNVSVLRFVFLGLYCICFIILLIQYPTLFLMIWSNVLHQMKQKMIIWNSYIKTKPFKFQRIKRKNRRSIDFSLFIYHFYITF